MNRIWRVRVARVMMLALLCLDLRGEAGEPPHIDHVCDLGAPGGQAFLQDRDGFLWIGTEGGGLFRYDGYKLKLYGVGPNLLLNGSIWRIVADRTQPDIFWIGTSGGLHKFDSATETFAYYRHEPDNPRSLGDNTVQDIAQDGADPAIFWLGTGSGGLNRFDSRSGEFTRFEPDPANPQSIAFGDVWRLIEDAANPNILWIGTYGGGLDKFDKQTGRFTHYPNRPGDANSFGGHENNVDALIQDKDDPNILWLGTPEDGMDKFDIRAETFTHFPAAQTNGEVALIYDDGRGRLWLGGYVTANGLTIFDKRRETFANYRRQPGNPNTLSDDLVVNVAEDRSGIFWIVTYSGKVDKIDPYSSKFALYQHAPDSLSNSAVNAIFEDRRGDIWIGTQQGLNRLNPQTGAIARYLRDPDNPAALDNDHILGIYEDSAGDFWVSLYVGPLIKFDRQTGEVAARYDSGVESVTEIVADPRHPDLLWMGTHGGGLAKFRKSDGAFTFYPPDPNDPRKGAGNNYVQDILLDRRENAIWFGGLFGGGLNRFDLATETFTRYVAAPDAPNALSADAIAALYQDDAGILWIGTKGGGLNRFDPAAQTFAVYSAPQGVPTDVNGILADGDGNLWLSANDGIVRFQPDTGRVDRRYTAQDGLQGDQFLPGSAFSARDGALWFGGTKGVNRIDPRALAQNPHAPPVVLTALTQGGLPLPSAHGRIPSKLRDVTLSWRQNFFEFEAAALNFTNPAQNQYQYILEGVDKTWYDAGTQRAGRYSNLPGGAYTLRVRGSNNHGVWNERGASLIIRVTSPWWKTAWFRGGGAALLLTALVGASWRRLTAVQRRNRQLARDVEERTKALTASNERLHLEIAEREQVENELRRHREELEDIIRERTLELSLKNEQLRQLEQAVDNMQLGLTIADLEGKIIYLNQTEAEMHGYAREELLGQDVNLLAPPELRKPLTLRQIREWKGLVRESVNVCKDGSTFPVWLMSEVVKNLDGEPCAVVTSCEDITERKMLEEERRKYRDHLEELVTERTLELTTANAQLQLEISERCRTEQELQAAKEAAESANRAKSDFLANMSHELRTPLNGILGYTQILKNDMTLTERPRHAIDVIHRSAEHLLLMITDILDLSKIEARKMTLDPMDFRLPQMLRTLIEIARVRADAQRIAFEYHVPAELPNVVHADEKRLRQVLLNLLSNATKFTKKGRIIFKVSAVSLNALQDAAVKYDQRRFRFEVEDSGIGISAEHLQEIFTAFHQIRDKRFPSEGTGLGLAISQRLVSLMGGELRVSSAPGKGSLFWFEIDMPALRDALARDDAFSARQRHVVGYSGRVNTVLIVDDYEANRAVLKDFFTPLGFTVIEAVNGQDAIEKAVARRPDVILIDVIMPVMDGLETTRRLRQMPEFRDVVILAISASVAAEKQQECLTAGCNRFLAKPFRLKELLELLSDEAGIEWVYADAEPDAPAVSGETQVRDDTLIPVSQEDLRRLLQFAKGGMITRLRKELDALTAQYPQNALFLAKVRELLTQFRIEELKAFILDYLEGEHGSDADHLNR